MDNPWLGRRVLNYAHQGGALEGPSSTLFALGQAIDRGATALELDVHASRDGVLVVCHDPSVDRTTNATGNIAELTYAEIATLDNAYYFVEGKDAVPGEDEAEYRYRGRAPAERAFGVARLDEVLEAFPAVLLNLDIKKTAPEVESYEEALASLLRSYGRGDDVIVTSFNDLATARFSSLAPEISTAPGAIDLTAFVQAVRSGAEPDPSLSRHAAIQMPVRYAGVWLVDEQVVAAAHALGLALHVWTVDERIDLERLLETDLDGVMTNRPSLLSDLLDRAGLRYVRPG